MKTSGKQQAFFFLIFQITSNITFITCNLQELPKGLPKDRMSPLAQLSLCSNHPHHRPYPWLPLVSDLNSDTSEDKEICSMRL